MIEPLDTRSIPDEQLASAMNKHSKDVFKEAIDSMKYDIDINESLFSQSKNLINDALAKEEYERACIYASESIIYLTGLLDKMDILRKFIIVRPKD